MSLGIVAGISVAVACALAVAFIWAGYPLAMRVVASARTRALKGRSDPPLAPSPAPLVSVVLATREEGAAVNARVANLLDTEHPSSRLEVVVAISAGSGPASYVFDDRRVRVVVADVPGGKWANLNAGVAAAAGEILVFADTAQRFEPATIPALVSAFSSDAVAAVTGWLALPPGVPAAVRGYWSMERALRRDEATLHSSIGVTGAVWALRRALWAPLPPGLILDDVYTPMRLVLEGHRIAVSDNAIARDTRAPQREAEFERKVRTLTGVYQVCAFLPDLLRPSRNPVWGQFVVHKLLRLATPFLLALGAVAGAVGLSTWLFRQGWLLPAVVAVAVVCALVFVTPLRRVARSAWDALHLQFAAVRATQNAWRGRWDVWR